MTQNIQKSDGGKIARNTLYLYIRMGVMMLVRLYTVRVVLEVLGIEDYGLWNVIMAFVTAFTFVSPTLVSSCQRFLNYELGRDGRQLRTIFSSSCLFFFLLAIVIIIILETFGVWFLNHKMSIPHGLYHQSLIVFQYCVLTIMADMWRMPYEAVIVSTERMSFYAMVSLLEAILLLGIVFLLPIWPDGQLLVAYGLLTFVAHTGISFAYVWYARRKAIWARIKLAFDKSLLKEMAAFSGWNIFGSLASMLAVQGINILMNVYFGVEVNSAYGVALQVHTAVFVFVVNINKASAPGIVKDYAAGAIDSMQSLILNVGKITYLLILLPVVPAVAGIDIVLDVWLGASNIPVGSPLFCILIMAQVLIVSFGLSIDSAVFATGKIRNYQLVLSLLVGCSFFGTWIMYAAGLAAASALWLKIAVEVAILIARLIFLQRSIGLPVTRYTLKVFVPVGGVTIVALLIMWIIWTLCSHFPPLSHLIIAIAIFVPCYLAIVWTIALTRSQRGVIATKLKNLTSKRA